MSLRFKIAVAKDLKEGSVVTVSGGNQVNDAALRVAVKPSLPHHRR